MKILLVAGARPNFVKIAPLLDEIRKHPSIAPTLVHTGQHYDREMSDRFFADLRIQTPDVNLGAGGGTQAVQTAEVMERIEPVLEALGPDFVLVVGDVNSTVAAALTAVKLGLPVAHVEAGLRSFDRSMPEEINRIVTDAVSDLLFVTEESGCINLLREGVASWRIHFVGNVMIDALEAARPRWQNSPVFDALGIEPDRPYGVLTLHRPSNVDGEEALERLLATLQEACGSLPLVMPVHPRTRPRLQKLGSQTWIGSGGDRGIPDRGIACIDPLGYLDCIALMSRARLVLTDSGGIQEETTILGVPCLTLRENTERPVTTTHGTNRVIGTDPARIRSEVRSALARSPSRPLRPPLWDGRAAERIVGVLLARGRREEKRPAGSTGRSRPGAARHASAGAAR